MTWQIYITPRFKKQIRTLRKADKKGESAAERAEDIISRLTTGGNPYELKSRLTKKGELRLDNALKYNLGAGYRMICLRRKKKLFILYVGAHDECDRFLTTHRGTKIRVTNIEPAAARSVEHYQPAEQALPSVPPREKDLYEERLLEKLDDKTLRRIFYGLQAE